MRSAVIVAVFGLALPACGPDYTGHWVGVGTAMTSSGVVSGATIDIAINGEVIGGVATGSTGKVFYVSGTIDGHGRTDARFVNGTTILDLNGTLLIAADHLTGNLAESIAGVHGGTLAVDLTRAK